MCLGYERPVRYTTDRQHEQVVHRLRKHWSVRPLRSQLRCRTAMVSTSTSVRSPPCRVHSRQTSATPSLSTPAPRIAVLSRSVSTRPTRPTPACPTIRSSCSLTSTQQYDALLRRSRRRRHRHVPDRQQPDRRHRRLRGHRCLHPPRCRRRRGVGCGGFGFTDQGFRAAFNAQLERATGRTARSWRSSPASASPKLTSTMPHGPHRGGSHRADPCLGSGPGIARSSDPIPPCTP